MRAAKVEPRIIPGKVGGWRPNSGRKRIYEPINIRNGSKGRNDISVADEPFFRRLAAKCVVGGLDECWKWSAAHNVHGRPIINLRGVCILAYRPLYYMIHGNIPVVVMHTCDNPGCVNPFHLRGGTQRDNLLDKIRKGRHHNCLHLSVDMVRSIKEHYKHSMDYTETGRQFGVTRYTVRRIVNNKGRWASYDL